MKNFKTSLIALCGLLIIPLLLTNCKKQNVNEVVILSVNDLHANVDNFPKFAALVDSLRGLYPDLLLVSAGDNQTGNPVNDQYSEKGLPMIELMNAVKFNLTCLGNHEFDVGLNELDALMRKSNFDYLCANMQAPTIPDFKVKPYVICKLNNGLKVAFLGLLQVNNTGIPDTHPVRVQDLVFTNPFEVAPNYSFLKDSADVFVAVTHLGFEEDVILSEIMADKGLHLIIGGHSHTIVEDQQVHNGIVITQAGNKLRNATLQRINVDNKKVSITTQLISIENFTKEDSSIRAMVDKYNDSPTLSVVVGKASTDFTSYDALGYLMADANRIIANADIALQNPGGVRINELKKGDITLLDVYKLDPFGNELLTINLTGQEILNYLYASYPVDHNETIPSGFDVKYTFDAEKNVEKIEAFIKGKPIDLNKTYKVAMSSYAATAYNFEHQDAGTSIFITTAQALINHIQNVKTVKDYSKENRITQIFK